MSRYRPRGGTWVSDVEQELLNKQRYKGKVARGWKENKSIVPDGFVKITNCDTGDVELITIEEWERREELREDEKDCKQKRHTGA